MNLFFEIVGIITIFCGCFLLLIQLYLFLKKVYNKQRKIKCICKHEYVKDFTFKHTNYDDIALKCRKCGKRKEITIWKDREMEVEE